MKGPDEAGMETEEAKDIELDEEAKPVRKGGGAVPVPDETNRKKRKGKRKVE